MTAHTAYNLRLLADLLVLRAEEMTADEFDAEFSTLLASVEDKAAAYRAVYFALKGREAEMKAEAERFAASQARAAASIERIKGGAKMLLEAREAVGEEPSIKAAWGSMRIQRNSVASMAGASKVSE